MITEQLLAEVKAEMENGISIPKFLSNKNLNLKPVDVRQALFEKYGKEEIVKIIQNKIIKTGSFVVQRFKTLDNFLNGIKTKEECDEILQQLKELKDKITTIKKNLKKG